MTSRHLKKLRQRQARDAAAIVQRRIEKHRRRAAEADELGLLNEAIYHANRVTFWGERLKIVSDPKYHALRSREHRLRGLGQGNNL